MGLHLHSRLFKELSTRQRLDTSPLVFQFHKNNALVVERDWSRERNQIWLLIPLGGILLPTNTVCGLIRYEMKHVRVAR